MKLIDKDVLVAKIDDWRHNIIMGVATVPLHGHQKADAAFEYEILGLVRDFLDTLEVKEVDDEPKCKIFPRPTVCHSTCKDCSWAITNSKA